MVPRGGNRHECSPLVVLVGVGEAEVRADHVALVAQQERLDARRPEVALPVPACTLREYSQYARRLYDNCIIAPCVT